MTLVEAISNWLSPLVQIFTLPLPLINISTLQLFGSIMLLEAVFQGVKLIFFGDRHD